ncbi:YpoC family protein [Peribacillus sp. SCS-37]|uniref:YpoC family protein n=1 Tax=Paraperibacillus esterisolvens TaxID=3115296 RepID=UPI003905D986
MSLLELDNPQHMKNELFQEKQLILIEEESNIWVPELLLKHHFPYEVCLYNGLISYKPWTQKEHVRDVLQIWKDLRSRIAAHYSGGSRGGSAESMPTGLSLLFSCLFWMHSKPVTIQGWEEKLISFSALPINAAERIQFIMMRPYSYHAYKQLDSLFIETEKIYYKRQVMKKNV